MKKIGKATMHFENVYLLSTCAFAGKKEGEGPLGEYMDRVIDDIMYEEKSWEKAEAKFFCKCSQEAVRKADLTEKDIDYAFAGDLLNQCGASAYGMRNTEIPFFGIYGACSTFGEAIGLGSAMLEGGFGKNILCTASSHFCSAEKQFRFPLDLGTQRPPSATWTATGAGSVVLSNNKTKNAFVRVTEATTGCVVDYGVKDAANMGGAMAPAAAQVIHRHFMDTKREPDYYDVIATGDLGEIGKELLKHLLFEKGIKIGENLTDCGIELFDKQKQDTHSGGSGCACSALTFCGYFYKKLVDGDIKRILLIPTGALMNTTASQQGESIPSVAHAVAFERID